MTLKELKMSLSKMPADLDDIEVIMNYLDNGDKLEFDTLAFTGYMEIPSLKTGMVALLGTEKAAHQRIREGSAKFPDGRKLSDDDYDVNG